MPMLACLWSLSAFWIFCLALDLKVRIERLTNGDGHESHTRRLGVRRPCACACPFLATPAGEWKFKSRHGGGKILGFLVMVLYCIPDAHPTTDWWPSGGLLLRYSGPLSVFQEPCLSYAVFSLFHLSHVYASLILP
jgi:hypothetical protein